MRRALDNPGGEKVPRNRESQCSNAPALAEGGHVGKAGVPSLPGPDQGLGMSSQSLESVGQGVTLLVPLKRPLQQPTHVKAA